MIIDRKYILDSIQTGQTKLLLNIQRHQKGNLITVFLRYRKTDIVNEFRLENGKEKEKKEKKTLQTIAYSEPYFSYMNKP